MTRIYFFGIYKCSLTKDKQKREGVILDIFLQLWGGVCYLLNKIFLSLAEGRSDRKFKVLGWSVYLVGVPAWVVILVLKHNWIAAAIETGGVPAMLLGLVTALLKGGKQPPRWLEKIAGVFVYIFLIVGVVYSWYDFGGITAISQVLEMGVMAGFLLGSYLLARGKPTGWLWFMLMNASMGILMAMQYKPILAIQQLISLCFVVIGFIKSKKIKEHDL